MAFIQIYNFTTETNFPPIFEGEFPLDGASVSSNTNVQITIADPNNNLDTSLLYIEYTQDFVGPQYDYIVIYDGEEGGFQPGFTSSTLNIVPGGSTDGYDAYMFNIISDTNYNQGPIEFAFYAEDTEGEDWDYTLTFTIESDWNPFLDDVSPSDMSVGISKNTNISFKVFNPSSILKTEHIYSEISFNSGVDWSPMYDGYSGGFQSGFQGPSSSVTQISEDGYDGYLVVIDPESSFDYDAYVMCNIEVYNPDID